MDYVGRTVRSSNAGSTVEVHLGKNVYLVDLHANGGQVTYVRDAMGMRPVTRETLKRIKSVISANNRNRSGRFPEMYSGPMKRSSWGVMPSTKEWKTHFSYYVPDGIYSIRNARELKQRDGDFTSSELRALVKRLSQSPNEERMSLASGIMETLGFEWI